MRVQGRNVALGHVVLNLACIMTGSGLKGLLQHDTLNKSTAWLAGGSVLVANTLVLHLRIMHRGYAAELGLGLGNASTGSQGQSGGGSSGGGGGAVSPAPDHGPSPYLVGLQVGAR